MTPRLPAARPEDAGLSSSGLARIDAALQDHIDRGVIAGAVTLVARHGREVHTSTLGLKDVAAAEPLAIDTLFRIFSMTKPVTGIAMMILHDQDLWALEDPVAKYLPELAGMKVFAGLDADGVPMHEEPVHAPTMLELMTHRAGFGYGLLPLTLLDKIYQDAGIWKAADLNEMVERLGTCPLAYQPGSKWQYSLSMDLQGAIIERLSGRSLPSFMQERIFGPLKMTDTAFFTPPAKADRLATLYFGSEGGLTATSNLLGPDHTSEPTLPLGGGGLISTAPDYARFAQMMLNHGELDGARIVSAEAVKQMMTNRLPDAMLEERFTAGHQKFRPGFGYGFNGVVFTDPDLAGVPVGKGTYHWDGAAGTWFWIDPENDLLFIGLIQLLSWTAPPLQALTQTMISEALLEACGP
jgi:CubicO group peptidase (beta-lactamase class C family)